MRGGINIADFAKPDWTAPIGLQALVAAIPPNSTVMGIFFQSAIAEAKAAGKTVGRDKYSPFTQYPTAELAQVLYDSATAAYPSVSPREGLRRLGQKVFPKIKQTTAGGFLFSVAGSRPLAAVKLVGKAYKLFTSSVSATATEQSEGTVLVELRNLWTFADCYHYGIIEGLFAGYSSQAEILVRMRSICDVDFQITTA